MKLQLHIPQTPYVAKESSGMLTVRMDPKGVNLLLKFDTCTACPLSFYDRRNSTGAA